MKKPPASAVAAGRLFSPQREILGLGRETITPGVRQKAVLCAAETRSFSRAEAVLRVVGEIDLSGRHLGRLARQVGHQLSDHQQQLAAEHGQGKQGLEVANAPELSVIEVDGGRINTRRPGDST